jgi:UDP-glucose 4-epimerase
MLGRIHETIKRPSISMSNMSPRILVTGGAGFIGSSLVDALMKSKTNEIIVFDNLSTGRKENISKCLGTSNFNFIYADMLDVLSLSKAVEDCDIVFHLAANPTVSLGANDSNSTYQQNLMATYNLLEAMRKSTTCKKIIFTSSSAVYGEADTMPTSERYSPLKPLSLYGATKLASEALISGYCHTFDMYGIALRLANIIGSNSIRGVIYDFIRKLSANKKQLDVLGDGKQKKSYLYIDDCINAFIHLLEKGNQVTFDIFNVGSIDSITVIDIADIVIRELSLENVNLRFNDNLNGRGWKGDVKEYLLDSSKLEACGWKPRYNSKEAIIITTRQLTRRLLEAGPKEYKMS